MRRGRRRRADGTRRKIAGRVRGGHKLADGERLPADVREEHYERRFGTTFSTVMHPFGNQLPHVDVYQYPPAKERYYWTLITGGMSDVPQLCSRGVCGCGGWRTEILMYVNEPKRWMAHALIKLARMPSVVKTFLHWGHTASQGTSVRGAPPHLTNFLIRPPYLEEEDAGTDGPFLPQRA